MTPLGAAAGPLGAGKYRIIAPDPAFTYFPRCHTRMSFNPDLANYDAWGLVPAGRRPMVLGQLTTFRPNP